MNRPVSLSRNSVSRWGARKQCKRRKSDDVNRHHNRLNMRDYRRRYRRLHRRHHLDRHVRRHAQRATGVRRIPLRMRMYGLNRAKHRHQCNTQDPEKKSPGTRRCRFGAIFVHNIFTIAHHIRHPAVQPNIFQPQRNICCSRAPPHRNYLPKPLPWKTLRACPPESPRGETTPAS